MENNIKIVAVLGSGTMGDQCCNSCNNGTIIIADNNCIIVLLLDISEDTVIKG